MDERLREIEHAYYSTGSMRDLLLWNRARLRAGMRGSDFNKLQDWWDSIPDTLFVSEPGEVIRRDAWPIRLMGGIAAPGEEFNTYHGYYPAGRKWRAQVHYSRAELSWYFNRPVHWISVCSKTQGDFGQGYYSIKAWLTEEGTMVMFDNWNKPDDLISYEIIPANYLEPNTYNTVEQLLDDMVMRLFVAEHDLIDEPEGDDWSHCGNCGRLRTIMAVEGFPDSYACDFCNVW